MEEYKCSYCEQVLGYVRGSKLYNRKKEVVASDVMRGYCTKCGNLNIWSPEPFVDAELVESVPQTPTVVEVVPSRPIAPEVESSSPIVEFVDGKPKNDKGSK